MAGAHAMLPVAVPLQCGHGRNRTKIYCRFI